MPELKALRNEYRRTTNSLQVLFKTWSLGFDLRHRPAIVPQPPIQRASSRSVHFLV